MGASPRRSPRLVRRPGPRLLALLTALGLLAGCGSATATHSAATAPAAGWGAPASPGAPSSAAAAATTPATAPASVSCAQTVASTLGSVASRVYGEATSGGIVAQATHRIRSSGALAAAVNSGNSAAARSALQSLLLGQIARVEVLRGGRVFAQAGSGGAIAPARGTIPGTAASFVLSTQPDHTYVQVVNQVTGAEVLLLAGSRRVAGSIAGTPPPSFSGAGPLTLSGKSFQAYTIPGSVYPSGQLRIVVLAPSSAISCPGSEAQARVETLGHVGERIYQEELHSPTVTSTLHHIESSSAFRRAVAAQDAAATRNAIVGFFGEHIHVVRVRVIVGGRLLVDVGGPFVLAPVHGTVHSGGKVVGSFLWAIQDDAGYLRLAHLFTGADVLMRRGSEQVMGTLSPGPSSVPARGPLSYHGRNYEAYSFTGEAFPSGPLRISLLLGS